MFSRTVLFRMFAAIVLSAIIYTTLMTNDQRAEYSLDLTASRLAEGINPNPTAPTYTCRHHTLGGLLMTDSDGYVCERFALEAKTGCCSSSHKRDLMSCYSCDPVTELDDRICCKWYEYCISCCIRASPPPPDRDQSFVVFSECVNACRTSSATLNEHRQYANETHRYCIPLEPVAVDSINATTSPPQEEDAGSPALLPPPPPLPDRTTADHSTPVPSSSPSPTKGDDEIIWVTL